MRLLQIIWSLAVLGAAAAEPNSLADLVNILRQDEALRRSLVDVLAHDIAIRMKRQQETQSFDLHDRRALPDPFNPAAPLSPAAPLGKVGGGGGGGLSGGLIGNLNPLQGLSLTDALTSLSTAAGGEGGISGVLAGAGMFLGIGLGEGTAQGLQLASADKTKAVGEKIAANNGQSATGLNSAIMNAAIGVSATLLTTVKNSQQTSGGAESAFAGALSQAAPTLLGLGTGLGSGTAAGLKLSNKVTAPNPNATDTPGVFSNFGFGLTNSFFANVDTKALLASANTATDTSKAMAQLPQAAAGLGLGLGNGAAMGLKLTTKNLAPNSQGQDIGNVVNNFAFGLSNSITSSLDTKQLLGQVRNMQANSNLASQLPAALGGLGTGIGNGVASGLKLTSKNVAPPTTGDDLATALNNFGFSLSNALTQNLNTTDLKSRFGGSENDAKQFAAQLPALAAGLGAGLGSGAAMGLKLTQNNVAPNPQQADVAGIASNFAFGLSNSVTSSINISELLSKASGSMGDGGNLPSAAQVMKMLPAVAAGLGKGLGKGAAIGLNLQPDKPVNVEPMTDGSVNVEGVAQSFSQSLVAYFLANGSSSKLNQVLATSNTPSNVDVGKVASGLGRGLLAGAGARIDAMGGIGAIMNGTAPMVDEVPDVPSTYNDSVNGAGYGLGQGLGSQGVVLILKLAKRYQKAASQPQAQGPSPKAAPAPPAVAAVSSALPPTHDADVSGTGAVAGVGPSAYAKRDVPLGTGQKFETREAVVVEGANGQVNLSLMLTAETLSSSAQKGLDALTCEGVGGLALVGLGLIRSNTLDLSNMGNLSRIIKQLTPEGIVRLQSSGNTYTIDAKASVAGMTGDHRKSASAVAVNGTTLIPLAVFLILHIFVALIALLHVYPAALALESIHTLMDRYLRVPLPKLMLKVPRIVNILWLFVITPSIFVVLIFGILANGNAKHFRTAHGILGLVSVFTGLGASALHVLVKLKSSKEGPQQTDTAAAKKAAKLAMFRAGVNQLTLSLLAATIMSGFSDLNSLMLCFTAVIPFEVAFTIGFSLAGAFILGSAVSGIELLCDWKDPGRTSSHFTAAAVAGKLGSSMSVPASSEKQVYDYGVYDYGMGTYAKEKSEWEKDDSKKPVIRKLCGVKGTTWWTNA